MDLPCQLGPYTLLRRLGAGGMAEVFLAVAYGASGFEKKIAIKTILPELRGRGDLERLIIEEARLGARLAHRNLVGVHELGVAEGSYYVRIDWIDGADLATLARRERPSPELALFVAEEVALALDFVHRATDDAGRALGVVHRDVSPANILCSRAGEVKLADFGIAKATRLADLTQGGVVKGKYAYMSPEQLTGEPLGPASDQFGLGVMLAELLTGTRPFDGEGPLETMDRIREAVPPALAGLPADLAAIVRRALERSPADRFESAEALCRALAEARRVRTPVAAPDLAGYVARHTERDAR